VPFTVYTWRLVNNGIVTSAGKYEYCTQAGNCCSFMDFSPTCPLLLLTRTQWIATVSHMKSSVLAMVDWEYGLLKKQNAFWG